MIIAIWIIACCELIRIAQNMVQLLAIKRDAKNKDNVYSEFIKSLRGTDREFVREMLEEYERMEEDE
ncbi:MAG: hypothetical protein IKN35_02145 [Lachnospiraceae bacterium]|nr:hypothetical protein [Lachnospiraceae bacterium]